MGSHILVVKFEKKKKKKKKTQTIHINWSIMHPYNFENDHLTLYKVFHFGNLSEQTFQNFRNKLFGTSEV